jgi:hypothetical protein
MNQPGIVWLMFLTPVMVGAAAAFVYWYTGLEDGRPEKRDR